MFNFIRIVKLFFKVTVNFSFQVATYKSYSCSISSSTFGIISHLNFSIMVLIHMSLMIISVEHLFMYLMSICLSSLWSISLNILFIFWGTIFYQIHILHIFSSCQLLAFNDLNGVILKSRSFHFDKVRFIKFLVYGLYFFVLRNLWIPKITMILSYRFCQKFYILHFIYRFMTHFKFIFLCIMQV